MQHAIFVIFDIIGALHIFFVCLCDPLPGTNNRTPGQPDRGDDFQALRRCLTGFSAPPRSCVSVQRLCWRCRGSATPGVPRARGSRAAAPPVSSPQELGTSGYACGVADTRAPPSEKKCKDTERSHINPARADHGARQATLQSERTE